MNRYIDADKVIEVIVDTPSMVGSKYDFDHDVLTALVDKEHEMIDLINNNVPTADVAPVIHAYNKSKDGFLCSACTFGDFGLFNHGGKYTPNYCPNCGARMDGEKE